jgi:hypothetical protein
VRRTQAVEPARAAGKLTAAEAEEAITLGLDEASLTEFGRLLIAARREFFAAEGRFLSREEIEREVAERRGGVSECEE